MNKVKTKQQYLTIQTFLSSSLLPSGNAPNAASVSWANAMNSNRAVTKKAWFFILEALYHKRTVQATGTLLFPNQYMFFGAVYKVGWRLLALLWYLFEHL